MDLLPVSRSCSRSGKSFIFASLQTLRSKLYYTILYYTILYYTILYYTILYYTILYYTVLYYTILYCTVLYCAVLYCTVLYYTLLYCSQGMHTFYGIRSATATPWKTSRSLISEALDNRCSRVKCCCPVCCRFSSRSLTTRVCCPSSEESLRSERLSGETLAKLVRVCRWYRTHSRECKLND